MLFFFADPSHGPTSPNRGRERRRAAPEGMPLRRKVLRRVCDDVVTNARHLADTHASVNQITIKKNDGNP